MNPSDDATDSLQAVRIPADISRPDRVFGPFTARQALILASAALVLYGAYWLVRPFIEPLAYVVLVIPVAGAVAALALGRREGIGLDRFVLSALVHARSPKRRVYAPRGVSAARRGSRPLGGGGRTAARRDEHAVRGRHG
ncbi:PrgI family protein [Streptomyces sp. C8S0]|uniref:PrgI family protein n=1 Tax=Streptomyces sp. C8S0 TaxID=2585716 RepID=UPI00299F8487|nr:PrgI family protein [Streptomyces sp. C8S0]